MNIIALDSSSGVAGAAIYSEGRIIGEYSLNHKMNHSRTLMCELEELAGRLSFELNTADAVAVARGPGSFTGLRIGVAAAKGLAMAIGRPMVMVPTLEGMACRYQGDSRLIVPMLDARRDQIYSGIYRFRGKESECLYDAEALSVTSQIERLNGLGGEAVLMGDGCDAFAREIEEQLKIPYMVAPAHMRYQSAAAVAVWAAEHFEPVPAEDAAPEYIRPSQAERVKNGG